jgi:hypothetical protein
VPAAARLVAVTVMLLVAASSHLVARSEPVGRWLPLLVVAVVGAVVAGAPARRWPLPAIWLVATLLATGTGVHADLAVLAPSLVGGAVALVAAVAVDLSAVLRDRRRHERS